MAHAGSLALLAALALGCTAEGPEHVAMERESSEVVRADPIDPADLVFLPAEPVPEPPLAEPPSNAPNDEFPLLPPGPAPRLRPVLSRDGPLHMLVDPTHMQVLVDGELISISRDGLRREPARGLESIDARPDQDLHIRGFVETQGGDAYLSTSLSVPRGGWYGSYTHRRAGALWSVLPDVREGPLVGVTESLLLRGDMVLGLRSYRPDPALEELPEHRALLAAWPPRFVALAGDGSVPTLPSQGIVEDLRADPEGRIYGLWREQAVRGQWSEHVPKLLVWSPDRSTPDVVELPDSAATEGLRLASSGLDVLVFGSPRYLAIARGTEVRRIRVVLPEPDEDDPMVAAGDEIGSARLTPDGALWISLNEDIWGQRVLLHQAPGKGWAHVYLPLPGPELNPSTRWYFGRGWTELEVEEGLQPEIQAILWSQGRIWIGAALRLRDAEGLLAIERELLYGVGAAWFPAESLPPIDRRWVQREMSEPDETCRVASLILGQRESLSRRQRSALHAISEREGLDALVYRGELEGRRELVVQVQLGKTDDASALARELGEALGLEVHADCRPRDFIALVLDLRSDLAPASTSSRARDR